MILLIVCLIGLLLWKSKWRKSPEGYLSKNEGNAIKGFFIILVFFRHALEYDIRKLASFNLLDQIYLDCYFKISIPVVAMFLFFSGYGIMERVKSSGGGYFNGFMQKRIWPTWRNFAIAVLIFILVQLAIGVTYPLKTYLLSFTAWESVGNSNWYIFCILYCYVIAFISFKLLARETKYAIISVILLCLFYIYFVSRFKDGVWYSTILIFPVAMIFSYYKNKIVPFLWGLKIWKWILAVLICGILFIGFKFVDIAHIGLLSSVFFALMIVILSMHIEFKSVWLEWAGRFLFPIYIYQRLPMLLMHHFHHAWCIEHYYLYLSICMLSTLLIAYCYGKITKANVKLRES